MDWRFVLLFLCAAVTFYPGFLWFISKIEKAQSHATHGLLVISMVLFILFGMMPYTLALHKVLDIQREMLTIGVPVSTENLKSNREI